MEQVQINIENVVNGLCQQIAQLSAQLAVAREETAAWQQAAQAAQGAAPAPAVVEEG